MTCLCHQCKTKPAQVIAWCPDEYSEWVAVCEACHPPGEKERIQASWFKTAEDLTRAVYYYNDQGAADALRLVRVLGRIHGAGPTWTTAADRAQVTWNDYRPDGYRICSY